MKITGRVLLTLILTLFLSACASVQTVEYADKIADAGIAYADTLPQLYDESFVIKVTANTLYLDQQRTDLPTSSREQFLTASNNKLTARLAILRDFKRHASLLRSYFLGIKSITQSDAATGLLDSTKDVVEKLSELRRTKLGKQSLDGKKIEERMVPIMKLVVAVHKNNVLNKELKARAPAIERELALQKAVLTVLKEQMMADKDLQVEIEERNPLVFQYIANKPLPRNWNDRRIAMFRHTIEIESLGIAEKAADNLHQSWVAFAERRVDESRLSLLTQDIKAFVDLMKDIKAANKK